MDPDNNTLGFYPPASFYFEVELGGSKLGFQEVSGINMEVDIQEVVCGGINDFKYRLPGGTKFSNLVLKRGLIPKDSVMATWVLETLTSGYVKPISPKNLTVKLLDYKKESLMRWDFVNAYPVKWNVSDFKSMENSYVVESLEFAFHFFKKK